MNRRAKHKKKYILHYCVIPASVGGFVGSSGVGGAGVWIEQLPGVKLIASIAISPM